MSIKKYFFQFAFLLLCVFVGGLVSIYYGSDGNWDLQNYHLYNPFHFLNNRIDKDFMAAGIQTYLNPVIDLPYYYVAVEWFQDAPGVVAFLAGVPYGVVIFLCLLIASEIGFSLPGVKKIDIFLAAVFGLTGTIVLSEVGTTFNDIQIAVIVLLALLIEIKVVSDKNKKGIFSGILLGLAAGLKITSSIFAPAMLVAVLVTSPGVRPALRSSLLFCFFWSAGFLISGGYWAYELVEKFGNPIFPFFNSIFHSPWYLLSGGRDLRFMPENWLHAIFYPFYWLSGKSVITELPMRDGRYAVAYMSVFIYAFMHLAHKVNHLVIKTDAVLILKKSNLLLVIVFFVVSYVVWELMFSLGRYAIPLELITGVLFLAGYKLCSAQLGSNLIPKFMAGAVSFLIFAAVLYTSAPMNWGRLQNFRIHPFSSTDFFATSLLPKFDVRLPENATIFVIGKPVAFVIPFVDAPGAVYFGLVEGVDDLSSSSPPIKMMELRLKKGGPVFVLTNFSNDTVNGSLSKMPNFVFDLQKCDELINKFQSGIRLCVLSAVHK